MIGFVYAVVWTPLGQAHRAKAKDTYRGPTIHPLHGKVRVQI